MRERKTVRWVVAMVFLGLAGLLVAATSVLRSDAFERYALARIIDAADKSTGTKIQVKGLEVHWSPFALEFAGVSAAAPSVGQQNPLFTASRIRLGLKLLPLLHKRVAIRELVFDRPAVYVYTKQDGSTNLPVPLRENGDTSMDVEIAELTLRDGLLVYDDRQIPLSAELHGVQSRIAFVTADRSYKGQIAYDSGQVQTTNIRTFEHQADLHFTANASRIVVEQLNLSSLHSKLGLRGELNNFDAPVFVGEYEGDIAGDDLRWILKTPAVPAGEMSVKGKLTYETSRGQSFLDRTSLDGTLRSSALRVPTEQSDVMVRNIRSGYRLETGALRVERLQAEVFGGSLSSDSSVIDIKRNRGQLRYALRGVSVDRMATELAGKAQPPVHLLGTAEIVGGANWTNGFQTLIANAHAAIRSPADATSVANAIPVNGVIDMDYDTPKNRASFGNSRLQTGSTTVDFSGVLSRDSVLNVRLNAKDLHELSGLLADLAGPDGAKSLGTLDLRGAADFTGKVSGSLASPHVNGQVNGSDLQFENTKWRSVRARIAADPGTFAIDEGVLVGVNKEHITLSGRAKLDHWSLKPDAPISLNAEVQNVSAGDAQRLAGTAYPIMGFLNGQISLTGSEQHPSGTGHVALARALVWNEPLDALSVEFNGDKQKLKLHGQAQAPAGTITVRGEYEPISQHYEASVSTQSLKLDQIRALQQKGQPVSGELTAEVSGSGTIQDPQVTGKIRIPLLQVRGEKLAEFDADASIRQNHGEFSLHSTVEQSAVSAKGEVELTGNYPTKMTIDTNAVPIGPLLARFMPAQNQGIAGQLEVHANFSGPLKAPAEIQGQAEIRTLRLQTKTLEIANVQPVTLEYRAGTLQIVNAELKGSGTDINIKGSVPIQQAGNMDLAAQGTVDLAILQDWNSGGQSSGQVKIQLNARGKFAHPDIRGRINFVNAAYLSEALPVGLESMNGEIAIDGNRFDVSNLSAKAGGGTLTLGGSATYGQNANFNLALDAESVRVRQNGVRAVVNANLALNGGVGSSSLNGQVTIDKLSFTQSSDLAGIIAQLSGYSTISEQSSFTRGMKLNVAVQSADNLNLSSSQLSIAGAANLNVVGTAANPVVLGRVSLTGGEVFFLGKRFEIQNGSIAFANTLKTEPVINLYATTTVEQYTITINLVGPVERLKTTYTADPGLPTADIINLLAFGQTTAESVSNSSSPGSLGAESAVASAVSGQVASSVQKLTGISQLSINPLAGNNQTPGSQVAVQQRVSGNVLLTFSTDVTSAQNASIQVQYQPRKNVSVSALRDENGGYGLDVRYHKAF
jgi:translocation and assembly module TamB